MSKTAPIVVRFMVGALLIGGSASTLAFEKKPVTAFPITLMDASDESVQTESGSSAVERVNLNLWRELAELREDVHLYQKEQTRLAKDVAAVHRALQQMQGSLIELQEDRGDAASKVVDRSKLELSKVDRMIEAQGGLIATLEEGGQNIRARMSELEDAVEEQTNLYEKHASFVNRFDEELASLKEALDAKREAPAEEDDLYASAALPAIDEGVEEVSEEAVQETILDERIFDALVEEDGEDAVSALTAVSFSPPEEVFGEASTLLPNDLVAEGNKLLEQNQADEAQEYYKRAVSIDPNHPDALLSLASSHYTDGDYSTAQHHIRRLLVHDEENAQALGLLGIIAWREGNYPAATKSLKKAVKLDEKDPQLHNYMGIVYYARNQHENALKALKKAVELDPGHAEARFNLAVLLASSKKPMLLESREHYETALRLGNQRDSQLEDLLYP